MTLFISHASEDQPDFVRPLAEALSREYNKVWYSEYELTLGDSLFEKINAGLASCDFGIVVLSKSFFEKKWPQAELDGLFALETRTRKIILPIWKDVTEDEVKAFSPILAGRLSVPAAAGLPKVLEQIRMAVSVSERQRQLSALATATNRVQKFKEKQEDKRRSEQLLASEEGAKLVSAGVENFWQAVQGVFSAGMDQSSPVKFEFSKNSLGHMHVRTVKGMYLAIRATNLYNVAINSVLEVKIFRRSFDRFNEPMPGSADFYDAEFKPVFASRDELVWVDGETSAAYNMEELAAHLINLFVQHVDEVIADAR